MTIDGGGEAERLRAWGDLPRRSGPPSGLCLSVRPGYEITEIDDLDLPAYLEHFRERDIHDWTIRIPHPYTIEDARAWLSHARATRESGSRSRHLAVRAHDGLLVGGVGWLASPVAGLSHQAEVGYWLAKPLWGRGIMTDALRALTAHATGRAGFRRLTATVFESNIASSRVLEKNGYQLEGSLRRHYEPRPGTYLDGRLYAFLA